jgi:hypothetical protein
LYRQALQLSINTLPSFHLCGFNPLKRPILLIASDRPIKQTSPPDQSILDTFFSGLYLIRGYKHTIASGKASSEFHLQRMITPSKSKEEPAQDDYELKEDN